METIQEKRHLDVFTQFGKRNVSALDNRTMNEVVAYTRVSGKEQEKNMSLPYQRQVVDEYAERNGLHIVAYFGGKYESAQTDGRKEFQRMLDYIKNSKGKISQILVYAVDRFSRTGGGAIKLAQDLREKYGVAINAISQPTDVSNPTGVFQQNIQFLFSNYDNVLRRQRVIAGMTYKFERGEWVVRLPMGYDSIRINGKREIKINDVGRKIQQAFYWKLQGLRSDEIVEKLKALGLVIYKQQMSKIFKNPFYCGMIAHKMLNGKVIEGTHEALISKELFLQVNDIMGTNTRRGVPHVKENNDLPLKIFVKCATCGEPFTGYLMKAKGIHYYKCRTNGCKCSMNANKMHTLFQGFIGQYVVRPELMEPLKYTLEYVYHQLNKDNGEQERLLKERLKEVDAKLDTIEEKHYALNQMDATTFEKFKLKYLDEKKVIAKELSKCDSGISNLGKAVEKAVTISANLQTTWALGDVTVKDRLQKLVFPDGIYYTRENGAFLTKRVNSVFELINRFTGSYEGNKNGTDASFLSQSLSAEREGFEPPEVLPSTVFKTASLNRSDISPGQNYKHYCVF